jgi:hypothetical protein
MEAAPGQQAKPSRPLLTPEENTDKEADVRASPFAGDWLYTSELSLDSSPGPYPAVYIECLLGDERGTVSGTYRAKYKVADLAISSEVMFHLQSTTVSEKEVRADWASRNGAKGILELTLESPDLMRVSWWTTEFGGRLSLSSGKALLIRRRAP